MKTVAALALLSAAALTSANPLLANRAACNADNCARQITGTNASPPIATRSADCASFQKVTVTPAPSTSTASAVTSTVTVSQMTTIFVGDPTAAAAKRQADGAVTNSPTSVPAYAAPCSGTSRYASACSCFGFTKTTSTAAASTVTVTPTSTVTSTAIATSTVTPGTRPACGSVVQGAGGCGCNYTVSCNAKFSGGRVIQTLNLLSEMECVNSCDGYGMFITHSSLQQADTSFDNCFNVDYSRVTGVCTIYQRADSMETVNDDDAYAFANTCTSDGSNPQCVVG